MQIAALDNIHLHWREDGDPDGTPVVFANSLGTDLRLWDKVLPLLPKGLRLIRFDLRGHGLSECPQALYSMAELADDAEALLDHIGVRDTVFVGLSIGGMIGQALASRRPDQIRALVLSNTATKMGTAQMWRDRMGAIRSSGIEPVADAILDRWFAAGFRATDNVLLWRNMLVRTPVSGYLGCCNAIANADLEPMTRVLRLPVLAIAGSDDRACPPELVRQTCAMIPGARYAEIPNTGHLPCVEAPATYAEHLSAFLMENRNE
jgi:3-oxoadipate enol-lactonase